jgi:hypothetical protein
MQRNKFDKYGKAFEIGKNAEEGFVTLMESKGWKITPATRDQDMIEHWDFLLEKEETKIKVEVKSEKRINRGDNETQSEWIWCELQNVRGDIGWLYGKSDYLAFQRGDKYHFINRETLVGIVESLIKSEYVTQAINAKYKMYRRHGRNDLLTMINFADIEKYCIEL